MKNNLHLSIISFFVFYRASFWSNITFTYFVFIVVFIENADLFVGADEGTSQNVMSALLARSEGAKKIAAISMEDKKFSKDNSLLDGGRQVLATIEEFAGKIMAAKDTQTNADFIVIARVEALIAGWGQEEALKRAHRYVEAGADCILIHSKSQVPDEVIAFVDDLRERGFVLPAGEHLGG